MKKSESYEQMHLCGKRNEEIRKEAKRLAVWDLQNQHLCGERYVGDMHEDGAIHYYGDSTVQYTDENGITHIEAEELIIRHSSPYVFRVSDEYHQLYIDHYYDGGDYTSTDGEDASRKSGESSNQ